MKFEYTFFDMNSDGFNEFHLKSPRSYDIFTVNDGNIELWYEGSPYENFTSDGNIFYCRHGGAPNNEEYIFKELDSDGNVVSEVSWSVYELDDRGSITADTVFYNGDGAEITKDEYYDYINKYDNVLYDYNWFVFYDNLKTVIWENINEESETNITIQYPAFYDMENTHLQDRINANIKQAVFEPYYDMLELLGDYSRTTWSIDYTVEYMSDRYISVVFNGYSYTMGAAHGTDYKYAVTVDLATGEKVNLSDVFDDSFVDYLTFENFGECVEIDFSGAFSEATDLIFTNIREEFERDRGNVFYDYFHFANGGFHITHAPQNSYFCFTADYNSLKDSMKEHPIWEELGVNVSIVEYSNAENASALPIDGEIKLLYASGAGAWGDYIRLQPDGSYTRNFHDVNMGEIGEENPNGTVYLDNEAEKFDLLKLDAYTYLLTVKESTHEYGYLEEWIEEGVKFVSTAPEYSDVGARCILALPEKSVQAIPPSVMEWDLDRRWGQVTESTLSYTSFFY